MDLGRKRPADEAILCRRVSQASTGSSPSHYVIPSPLTSLFRQASPHRLSALLATTPSTF